MLVSITLNGFVKRTLNTEVLKVAIKSTGATLTRKGRSKNWLLQANDEQIRNITAVPQFKNKKGLVIN